MRLFIVIVCFLIAWAAFTLLARAIRLGIKHKIDRLVDGRQDDNMDDWEEWKGEKGKIEELEVKYPNYEFAYIEHTIWVNKNNK